MIENRWFRMRLRRRDFLLIATSGRAAIRHSFRIHLISSAHILKKLRWRPQKGVPG